jgi:hypothetical protein
LAETAGLAITNVWYDSSAFQFWASELYRRGIALAEGRPRRPGAWLLNRNQTRRLEMMAKELNLRHDGDEAGFLLRHKN